MTESLIRENETHLYGPRGARKRHSKLARGPICCYFINRPASVEKGREVVTHPLPKTIPILLLLHGPRKQNSSLSRKWVGWRIHSMAGAQHRSEMWEQNLSLNADIFLGAIYCFIACSAVIRWPFISLSFSEYFTATLPGIQSFRSHKIRECISRSILNLFLRGSRSDVHMKHLKCFRSSGIWAD